MNKISFLVPTRKRFELFKRSMDSLRATCSSIDSFEVLVAMDDDDTETILKTRDYISDKPNIQLHVYKRRTYYHLHEYINDLYEKSCGDSIFGWNDDCLMVSQNWDVAILRLHEKFCVISPKIANAEGYWRKQGAMFPILPRKWVEITGQVSPITSFDSWIDVLSKRLDTLVNSEEIVLDHICCKFTGQNDDDVYKESRAALVDRKFNRSEPEIMERHYARLKDYIDKNRESVPVNIWKPT
jgi:hypothetical protein